MNTLTSSEKFALIRTLATSEKFSLIRWHGDLLSMAAVGAPMTRKSDVLESAARIIDLAKSIPKAEWGTE